jgi:hypothetical protein
LLGVKTTLNRLAEKPEFSWQAFNELDWRICSPRAGAAKAASEAKTASGLANDGHRILRSEDVKVENPVLVFPAEGGSRRLEGPMAARLPFGRSSISCADTKVEENQQQGGYGREVKSGR